MIEYPKYKDNYTIGNKLKRLNWNIACLLLFRPFTTPLFNKWRLLVLRVFGAKIGKGSIVYASSKIWAPWNLIVGQRTCIGPYTIIYNPGRIVLGNKVAISQYSYLCTASHDYESKLNTLFHKEIVIDDFAWVAARAFIGPGCHIHEGAVVGATASVYKDVEPWTVVGGNPARVIKQRIIKQ